MKEEIWKDIPGYEGEYKVSIIQMKENGEYIKEWKSIKEAASFYNVTPSAIRCALTGYRSRACGYKWKEQM